MIPREPERETVPQTKRLSFDDAHEAMLYKLFDIKNEANHASTKSETDVYYGNGANQQGNLYLEWLVREFF